MKSAVAVLCLASFAGGLAAQEIQNPRIHKFPTREVFNQRLSESFNLDYVDGVSFKRGNNLSYHNGPVILQAKVVLSATPASRSGGKGEQLVDAVVDCVIRWRLVVERGGYPHTGWCRWWAAHVLGRAPALPGREGEGHPPGPLPRPAGGRCCDGESAGWLPSPITSARTVE